MLRPTKQTRSVSRRLVEIVAGAVLATFANACVVTGVQATDARGTDAMRDVATSDDRIAQDTPRSTDSPMRSDVVSPTMDVVAADVRDVTTPTDSPAPTDVRDVATARDVPVVDVVMPPDVPIVDVVSCTSGVACTPANPCHAGATDCTSGSSVCRDTGVNLADGTACGGGRTCTAGTCACNDNPCLGSCGTSVVNACGETVSCGCPATRPNCCGDICVCARCVCP